jgi:hypothetical protein
MVRIFHQKIHIYLIYYFAECRCAECRYDECRYAECRSAMAMQQNISSRNFFSDKRCGWKYLPRGITHLFIASLTTKKFSNIANS